MKSIKLHSLWMWAALLSWGLSSPLFGQVDYDLKDYGISHLYWPFEQGSYNSPSFTENGSTYKWCQKTGSICHNKADYHAQDWRITGNGDDCQNTGIHKTKAEGRRFGSPVYGRVMYVHDNTESGINQQGAQVVIEVSNGYGFFTGHALRVMHLQLNSALVDVGDWVQPGTPLGKVGHTGGAGSGDWSHNHFVLYKQIDEDRPNESYIITGRALLKGGNTMANNMCNSTPKESDGVFATQFRLDATRLSPPDCYGNYLQLGGTYDNRQVCIAYVNATTAANTYLGSGANLMLQSPATTISSLGMATGATFSVHSGQIPQKNGMPIPEEDLSPREQFYLEAQRGDKMVAYPNPTSGATSFAFSLKEKTAVTLEIHNSVGQVVRRMIIGTLLEGAYERQWDGTDSYGKRLPAGTYYCIFQKGMERQTLSLVLTP